MGNCGLWGVDILKKIILTKPYNVNNAIKEKLAPNQLVMALVVK